MWKEILIDVLIMTICIPIGAYLGYRIAFWWDNRR
jgi:hypothetical protein